MAARQIKGIPANLQILHVEQELPGDETTVLDAVLAVDGEREELLAEEASLLAAAGGAFDRRRQGEKKRENEWAGRAPRD